MLIWTVKVQLFVQNIMFSEGLGRRVSSSMIPGTGFGQIPSETAFFPALSCKFPHTSGWKEHRKMEAVFRPELHRARKLENSASSLYRILSGSKRDPSGKPAINQRFPSEPGRKRSYRSQMSAKKYWFPRNADKIIQYFLDHGKTNKKSLLKISVRLS